MKRKLISMLLTLCMVLSLLPVQAMAANHTEWPEDPGTLTVGDTVHFTIALPTGSNQQVSATYQGDVTETGLNLSEWSSDTSACYKAGDGYIVVNKFNDIVTGSKAMPLIVLHNATVNATKNAAITLPEIEGNVFIRVEGAANTMNSGSDFAILGSSSEMTDITTGIQFYGSAEASLNANADSSAIYGILLNGMIEVQPSLSDNFNALVREGYAWKVFGTVTNNGFWTVDKLQVPHDAKLINKGYLNFQGNNSGDFAININGELENNGWIGLGNYLGDKESLIDRFTGTGTVERALAAEPGDSTKSVNLVDGPSDDPVGRHIVFGPDSYLSYLQGKSRVDEAVLTLHNVSMEVDSPHNPCAAIIVKSERNDRFKIVLEGENTIKTLANGNPAIDIVGHKYLKISGTGSLTAVGRHKDGIDIKTTTTSDMVASTATVQAALGTVQDGEVNGIFLYGTHTLTADKTIAQSFWVMAGSKLTVPQNATLTLSGSNLVINDGTIENNGFIVIDPSKLVETTPNEYIKALQLTGTGKVTIGGTNYENDGEDVALLPGMDFTLSAAEGNWKENATLEADGYTWNSTSNTLTLGNLELNVEDGTAINLPRGSTMELRGNATVTTAEVYEKAIFGEDALTLTGTGNLTANGKIEGGTLKIEGGSYQANEVSAEVLTVTGNTVLQANEIYVNNSERIDGSVTVDGNASITAMVLCTDNYTQTGGQVLLGTQEIPTIVALQTLKSCTITGGTLQAVGNDVAVACRDGQLTVGPDVAILIPEGGKVLNNGKLHAIVDKDQTELLLDNDTGMPANAAKSVTIGVPAPADGGGDNGGSTGSSGGVTTPSAPWESVGKDLAAAKDGDTVKTNMKPGATEMPGKTLDAIAGKNINLEVNMGDGATWQIIGKDVPPSGTRDLQLGINTRVNSIPTELFSGLTGQKTVRQLSLIHDGPFDVKLTLLLDVGKEHSGLWANLFYYNPTLKQLEVQSSVQIDGSGVAKLAFAHASDYAVVSSTTNHAAGLAFSDVAQAAWYFEAVNFTVQKGLFSGTTTTTFSPNTAMSRAMLWTVLARMDGQTVTGGANWYEKAQTWAISKGITDGSNPDGAITGEQIAATLYRYAGSPKTQGVLTAFADSEAVSGWAENAMKWAVEQGIIQGADGLLSPGGEASRAQVAKMLMVYLNGKAQ